MTFRGNWNASSQSDISKYRAKPFKGSRRRSLVMLVLVCFFFWQLITESFFLKTVGLGLEDNGNAAALPSPDLLYKHSNNATELFAVEQCSQEQMAKIEEQLGLRSRECNVPSHHRCPIFKYTSCPEYDWLQDYFRQDFDNRRDGDKFLGISIGCNKGYDAIDTARMGMNDPEFDKLKWVEVLAKEMSSAGVCKQRDSPQFEITAKNTLRTGEMHCVEPMPRTFKVLQNATNKLGFDHKPSDRSFVLTNAAVSSADGVVKFPSAAAAGVEDLGINTCKQNKRLASLCEDVPMYSLQTYVNKFVKSKGPINILSIDVEGFDFDVLFGAGSVLDRVEYLEFEYHVSGTWRKYHLMDAVGLLNQKGFTCYWSGKEGKLWRITECDHDAYGVWHHWSNVACVHRSQKVLGAKMEKVFSDTLGL